MKLDSLKVIAATTDISNLIQGMTLYESINGFVKGSLQILDGVNFYDEVIGYHDKLIPIKITYTYMKVEITNTFMADGVGQQIINKSNKEYIIHLISPVEQALKLTKILNVYHGPSHQIANNIFKECMGADSQLAINTLAVTKGKYIVPNISAFHAISNVVNNAVDNNGSGFYLFQNLTDEGVTRMTSVKSMADHFFKDTDNSNFKIKHNIPNINEIIEGSPEGLDGVGIASKFTMDEYKMNHTNKLADGYYGNKINTVTLDKTQVIKNNPIEYSNVEITRYKTSANLYDSLTNNEVSLFDDISDPTNKAAINQKKRLYNTSLQVANMVAIPTVGCGMAMMVEQGGTNTSRTISDGPYIISDINHVFQVEGNSFRYFQNMSLIREFA